MTAPHFVPAELLMTVLNEADSMSDLLDSISRLRPSPQRVIIVDAGSQDATADLAKAWNPPTGMHVVVIEAPGANISEGRNIGIMSSDAEYILVTDAGTTLAKSWAGDLYDALESGADVACGFFEPQHSTLFSSALGMIITPHLAEIDPSTFLPSSRSVGFRRSALLEAQGYPEWLDYCEDLVLDIRLKALNKCFVFVPTAVASWDARPTLRQYSKQYYLYARGDGKSGLWTGRHLARYAAYALGALLAATCSPRSLALLAAGVAIHFSRPVTRVIHFRGAPPRHRVAAAALVPFAVVVGDLAKMLGYPAGITWRFVQRSRVARASTK